MLRGRFSLPIGARDCGGLPPFDAHYRPSAVADAAHQRPRRNPAAKSAFCPRSSSLRLTLIASPPAMSNPSPGAPPSVGVFLVRRFLRCRSLQPARTRVRLGGATAQHAQSAGASGKSGQGTGLGWAKRPLHVTTNCQRTRSVRVEQSRFAAGGRDAAYDAASGSSAVQAFGWHEAHARSLYCLTDGLSIGSIRRRPENYLASRAHQPSLL